MDYESVSDFEINKAVAESVFPDDEIITTNVNGYPPKFINDEKGKKAFYEIDKMLNPEKYNDSVINIRSRGMSFVRDFCNNPSDAWPIIMKNKLTATIGLLALIFGLAFIAQSGGEYRHFALMGFGLAIGLILQKLFRVRI